MAILPNTSSRIAQIRTGRSDEPVLGSWRGNANDPARGAAVVVVGASDATRLVDVEEAFVVEVGVVLEVVVALRGVVVEVEVELVGATVVDVVDVDVVVDVELVGATVVDVVEVDVEVVGATVVDVVEVEVVGATVVDVVEVDGASVVEVVVDVVVEVVDVELVGETVVEVVDVDVVDVVVDVVDVVGGGPAPTTQAIPNGASLGLAVMVISVVQWSSVRLFNVQAIPMLYVPTGGAMPWRSSDSSGMPEINPRGLVAGNLVEICSEKVSNSGDTNAPGTATGPEAYINDPTLTDDDARNVSHRYPFAPLPWQAEPCGNTIKNGALPPPVIDPVAGSLNDTVPRKIGAANAKRSNAPANDRAFTASIAAESAVAARATLRARRRDRGVKRILEMSDVMFVPLKVRCADGRRRTNESLGARLNGGRPATRVSQ